MNVYYNTNEAIGKIVNPVITTGSFDGVHIGHKMIISRLNQIARDIGGESVLITFHPHPRKVLYPEQLDLKLINSQDEKIELLRKAGLDNLIIIPFTIDFSKTTSHDFITNILIGQLAAKVIVVGHNHHFGHNRHGDYSYLHSLSRELGFAVEEIPLKDIENETVSSTKIRKALFEGNIQRANAYLDHQYIICGKLSLADSSQNALSLPVVLTSIEEKEKLVPPPGIYATNLLVNGEYLKSLSLVTDDLSGLPKVRSLLLYDQLKSRDTEGILYFYKKVSDIDTNAEPSEHMIRQAKELVEDLIY